MLQIINIQIVLFGFLSTINGFDLKCPHPSQRTYRIQSVCNGNSSAYTCLYETRKKGYVEFCANRKDNYVRAGLKYVISGTFRNVRCSDGRYQPVRFWSNQSSVCMNLKSECNGFGEIVYNNRSSIYDATCRCDYTRGYAFVSEPQNKCFCIPSEEDCSCYLKQCRTNTLLSPDYKCILANEKFYCQADIKRQKKENGTAMAVLFDDNERWIPWTRSGKIVLSGLVLGISVISVILVVMYVIFDTSWKGKQPGSGGLFETQPAASQQQSTRFNFGITESPSWKGKQSGSGGLFETKPVASQQQSTGFNFEITESRSNLPIKSVVLGGPVLIGTTLSFNAPYGKDIVVKNGQSTNVNTRHQCITAMWEYQKKSLEELRVEDYAANRKGKQPGSGELLETQPTATQQQGTGTNLGMTSSQPEQALPWIGNPSEFKVILSEGEYASYDNRVFLSGACNSGKTTLASVLIGDVIPKKWNSTNGLVVYFGRNGINVNTMEMLPLKEGLSGSAVYSRILRGGPTLLPKKIKLSIEKSSSRLPSFDGKIGNAESERNIKSMEADEEKENENVDSTKQIPLALQKEKKKRIGEFLPEKHEDLPDVLKVDHFTVRKDILEEVRKGQYTIEIAPSDLVDFGGQRSYDMTHQLFIQHQGSFILMFNGSYDLKKPLTEYPQGDVTSEKILIHWINSILTYCPEGDDIMPMVLFVATHSDEFTAENKNKRKEFLQREIENLFKGHEQKKHMFLDRVYFIDGRNSDDPEIKALTQKLVEFAIKQPTWGKGRPMAWVPLELQIDNMRSQKINIITRKQLEDINKLNEDLALTEVQLEDFLRNQHLIGKVMYYKQPGLDGFIIIHSPALVNILKSFITDEHFWPEDDEHKRIHQNLFSTGIIYKSNLWELWSQESFRGYLPTDKLKAFVTRLLIHLDILIHPKDNRVASADEMFLVPCMITRSPPTDFFVHGTEDYNTIVLVYSLAISSIPSALAFKLIGAVSNNFPLKEENGKQCLFHKAAIFMVDDDIEIRMCLEDNCVMINLINRNQSQVLSPDIVASIQECLTKTLKSSIAFYYESNRQQVDPREISNKISIKVGVVFKNSVCLLTLEEASQDTQWTCNIHQENHQTKYPMYWFFDRKQTKCHEHCSGLNTAELGKAPSDKHLIRLACEFDFNKFRDYIVSLGLDEKEFEKIWRQYEANDEHGIMFMTLIKWMNCCKANLQTPSLNHLQDALIAIQVKDHLLCQVSREDTSLNDKLGNCLQIPVDDNVLKDLPKRIGNCIIHLGVELGVSVDDIEAAIYNNSKDMYAQIKYVLMAWKRKSQHPTVFALLKALQRVKSGGLSYLCEQYKVVFPK